MHHNAPSLPPLVELAARLSLTVSRSGITPCPACGAVRRGAHDTRPPVQVFGPDQDRWGCKVGGCGAGGGAVALFAYYRCGEVPPKGDARWPSLFSEVQGHDSPRPATRRAQCQATLAPPMNGLDRGEVAALWARCSPLDTLTQVDPTLRWLRARRGLSVELMAALDLARVMPTTGALPRWVPTLGVDPSTWRAVYRLAVPVYTALGELAALRWRAVDRHVTPTGPDLWGPPPGCTVERRAGGMVLLAPRWNSEAGGDAELRALPKSLAARGCGRAVGLVVADPMGLALLRGERAHEGMRWSGVVFIVEGEPDLWAYATTRLDAVQRGETFAVFGVAAGSWLPEHAARIPEDAHVVVDTDDNDAGDHYFEAIKATLLGRCQVGRRGE